VAVISEGKLLTTNYADRIARFMPGLEWQPAGMAVGPAETPRGIAASWFIIPDALKVEEVL
jgi:hypothetical protein